MMPYGKLAKSLARPATSGETFRRHRVGRATPRVDFRPADASSTSSEAAAENARAIQAQWMLDYVRELEGVDPALATEVRRLAESGTER